MIWLLRHAEAAPAVTGGDDAQRPLTATGERQAAAAGEALRALGVEVEACLTSPKLRALQTARIATAQLGIEVTEAPELGGGDFDPEALAAGRGEHVLLVGHEPDFSRAIQAATGARVKLRKGGLAAIGDGLLHLLAGPAELAAIASCDSD